VGRVPHPTDGAANHPVVTDSSLVRPYIHTYTMVRYKTFSLDDDVAEFLDGRQDQTETVEEAVREVHGL